MWPQPRGGWGRGKKVGLPSSPSTVQRGAATRHHTGEEETPGRGAQTLSLCGSGTCVYAGVYVCVGCVMWGMSVCL